MLHKKNIPEWILASASPRRKEILSNLGLGFQIDPSHIQEPAHSSDETPPGYVVRLARLKAKETATRHPSGLIIGADTVVAMRNRLLGKPSSREEASDMLCRLSGRWHEVWSGLCLLRKPGRFRRSPRRSVSGLLRGVYGGTRYSCAGTLNRPFRRGNRHRARLLLAAA